LDVKEDSNFRKGGEKENGTKITPVNKVKSMYVFTQIIIFRRRFSLS